MSCPGSSRIMGVHTWYVPKGMTPTDRTYCTYCYDNKCMRVDVWQWQSFEQSYIKCSCTNDHSHVCQKCRKQRWFVATTESTCTNCGGYVYTCSLRYCQKCSHVLEACAFCGKSSKSDDDKSSDKSSSKSDDDNIQEPDASEDDEDLVQCQII